MLVTVAFEFGYIVPADCQWRLTEALNVSYRTRLRSPVTPGGESLPVSKEGDQYFYGSTCKQGEAKGVVISTGDNTVFGRATSLTARRMTPPAIRRTFWLRSVLSDLSSSWLRFSSFILSSAGLTAPVSTISFLISGLLPHAMPTRHRRPSATSCKATVIRITKRVSKGMEMADTIFDPYTRNKFGFALKLTLWFSCTRRRVRGA